MEPICLKDLRGKVDNEYIGFSPNSSSVKPVHIASGVGRVLANGSVDIKSMHSVAYLADAKGKTPKGHENETVYSFLVDEDALDEDEVKMDDFESFRGILQKLINADKGVYPENMHSYTAGTYYFIGSKSVHEDGGELVGKIVKRCCPELSTYVCDMLSKHDDPITSALYPTLGDGIERTYVGDDLDEFPAFEHPNKAMQEFQDGMRATGQSLLQNMQSRQNGLANARLLNNFCILQLLRYLASLEAFYCDAELRTFLLDFSDDSSSAVARSSALSYTQVHQSVSRFYSWAFAQQLQDYGVDELRASDPPVYEKKKAKSANQSEIAEIWEIARGESEDAADEEARLIYGAKIYEILAMEASASPVNYLRALGTRSGILYPNTRFHPNKRFAISQDIIEMLMKACVSPKETITSAELRHRLWERFRMIIGGSEYELQQTTDTLMHVDSDALDSNFDSFCSALESMNFAEIMADGIMQIRLGV